MRYSLERFNQEQLIKKNLDEKDIFILAWFTDFAHSGKMSTKIINEKEFYWVNYQAVIDDLPILRIGNREVLARRFSKYVKNGVIEKKVVKNHSGTYTFFRTTPEYYELMSPTSTRKSNATYSKVECAPDSKVDPKDSTTNNSITNINNIASQSSAPEEQDLFTIQKPKKEKPEPKELVQIINGKPDFNESESLHNQIKGFFQHCNKSGYKDFQREGRCINNIIKRAKLYYPEFPERDTLRTIIQKFYELKEQQVKFWKDQPFLPSTIDVKRMWDMLVALIEEPKKEESRLDDIFDRLEKKYQPKRIERDVI